MTVQEGIFIGANKQTQVADVHSVSKTVAYGAGTTIALWNPIDSHKKGVYTTLKGHTKEVTGIKFVPNSEFLVSISEDSTIRIWRSSGNSFELHQTVEFHTQSVTCLSVLNEDLFCVGSADGQISLWSFESGSNEFELAHNFRVKVGFFPLTLELVRLDGDVCMLAIGGTTTNLFIYSFTFSAGKIAQFHQNAVLEGHEDWIRCLRTRKESDGNWLLASGSQDRYIRLWRLRINDQIDNSDEDTTKLTLLSNKQYKFDVNETKCAFNFEALIMGHDDWVTSIIWHPDETKLQLLSSSADTALMVWEMDELSGIWVCSSRLGEMSIKGASTATGASGGFWSCLWFEANGTYYILTNGKTGSFRAYSSTDCANWDRELGVTGPTKESTGLSWSERGDYLLATSLDQTTRLYSQWVNNADGTKREISTWHEFARPQIHGYDMVCVSSISNTRFISGADEKILRSFDEPKTVSDFLSKFCDIRAGEDYVGPESASLPVLGLSNKAANENGANEAEQHQDESTNTISAEILSSLTFPPIEDHLQRHTLWPEVEKLYGHGYEIVSVDVSPDKSLIATACRSNSSVHAVIRIFDAVSWLELKPSLTGHNLTITSLKFSPDGKYLLAVSRDRQFSLWKRDGKEFHLVYLNEKAHTRIIWDCSWAPISMGSFFFTSSRDRSVKMWKTNQEEDESRIIENIHVLKLNEAITSIDVYCREVAEGVCLVVAGLEDGGIQIITASVKDGFKVVDSLDTAMTPADRIQKISWSSKTGENLTFAAVSNDSSTRIYSFDKKNI